MIAGYIEKSSVQGMAFTVLIFALTAQNFFIYRDFWERSGVNDPNSSRAFGDRYWEKINYINQGNSLQNPYSYTSASFLDAVAAAIAMYVGYSAVIGRIGLGEIFFLTWIGPFFYECNSQLLWRFFWTDTGYPSRAFAFGSALALISSLILGKFDLTRGNPNFGSRYKVMGLALLGIILVWCSYPILLLASTYETTTSSSIVAETGQVNIWMALAASVLGVFSASSIFYKKFSVHELVFASITVYNISIKGSHRLLIIDRYRLQHWWSHCRRLYVQLPVLHVSDGIQKNHQQKWSLGVEQRDLPLFDAFLLRSHRLSRYFRNRKYWRFLYSP